ncbi:MAG: hypothetical protein IPK26_08900 [Planctomycetes bacterium]|nr:hypothetical protein [Planctomycetota bacterium]
MTNHPMEPGDGEAWSELDDTLADGPAPAEVPPAAQPWLCEQRFIHGLLRAMQGADAQSRESRIDAVLERTRMPTAATGRWWFVAAAAAVLAVVVLWSLQPARTLSAEAAVKRAAALLAENVDRRFLLDVTHAIGGGAGMRAEFTLTARPQRFLADGKIARGGQTFADFRVGCDGERVWFRPANGVFARDVALADADRLTSAFGGALDLGYFDVHTLLDHLAANATLTAGGEERGAGGERLMRIDAHRGEAARMPFQDLRLWYDLDTGMVVRIEGNGERRGVTHQAVFRYVGVVTDVTYQRPW